MTEGNGVVNQGEDALVVAFVVGAEDDEVESGGGGLVGGGRLTGGGGTGGKSTDQVLVPDLTDGSGEDDFSGGVGSLDALNRSKYWFAAQEHTVAAAVRCIIYRAMRTEAEIAQVNVISDNSKTDERLHIYIISYFAR